VSDRASSYDAIVVGAGHAGVEAALAIARSGFETLLLSMSLDTVSKMSCNPAIGGLAKGHIVREIDALGGEMAKATDATGIQFRMLNTSKGPAVWAPRAQCDKKQYSLYMKRVVETQPQLNFLQEVAEEILVEKNRAIGIRTQSGKNFYARAIVITTGTFMKGLIHIGEKHFPGGRGGEPAGENLSDSLRKLGLEVRRFKTGTPPRLWKSSIDFSVMEAQAGDVPARPFSHFTRDITRAQISCFLCNTTAQTHDIIRKNLHRSPLYGGIIQGVGPRYCPSIEDKIVKFADKPSHQIYLEPEGLDTEEVYVNGMSTSLPQDVQLQVVRSIKGLEKAEIARWGYAIEYDYCPPTQLHPSLETKAIENLFLAGQVNATSGYEEAASQGLMAGLNVIRKLRGEEPFVLKRSEAYIGVLIDDLVTRGTNEPYRMFTSRAEFRLLLRQDNADSRLMAHGRAFGLISESQFAAFEAKQHFIAEELKRLTKTYSNGDSLLRILRRPETRYQDLPSRTALSTEVIEALEIIVKYEGYITKQLTQAQQFKRLESKQIPDGLDYSQVRGLGREATEKLGRIRPVSLGQASRIPGINQCDLSLIAVYLRRYYPLESVGQT
jgi:tRNA uridine 5-carboxymethylaminomethyl modification enzyme